MTLERLSERTGPLGGITAEGLVNVLGRPRLDRLALALREAVQNSWDARSARWGGQEIVPQFCVRIRTMTTEQGSCLRKIFTQRGPDAEPAAANELALRVASQAPIRVLEICDFATVGLRGPYDLQRTLGEAPANFRNFFFDIGVAHHSGIDGGTYGYGRSSLYLASRARTILVDTLTVEKKGQQRRIMAARIGHAYEAKQLKGTVTRFTGRHFWGRLVGDGIVPMVDDDASMLAASLGLPPRPEGRTGTTIVIPWPDEDGNPITGHQIVDALLFHLWPKMVSPSGPKAMSFSVEDEGKLVSIPSVRTHPVYGLFAAALLAARSRSSRNGAREIKLAKPEIVTGHLGLEVGTERARKTQAMDDDSGDVSHNVLDGGLRHVALMRPSELVVRYLEIADARQDARDWAGVFLCVDDPEVRDAFALAEPPAHDDWIPDRIEDRSKRRLVNRTVTHLIPTVVREAFGGRGTTAEGTGALGPSLAAAADGFSAEFLSGNGSAGVAREPNGGRGQSKRSRGPKVRLTLESIELRNDIRVARFKVGIAGVVDAVDLLASPSIVLDGVLHPSEVPPGIMPPEVLGWTDGQGRMRAVGSSVRVEQDEELRLDVAFHGEYAVGVSCEVAGH